MILNLTQHKATQEQVTAGVVDFPEESRDLLVAALTFDELPTLAEIEDRAEYIARDLINVLERDVAPHGLRVMVGGAPFFMAPLVDALKKHGYVPCFAFSQRESVESHLPDGKVVKTAVFRHVGFVEA